jgi:hypothetical protein
MPSSLDLLQFQPIRFGYSPETCANNDDTQYCNLVQDGDPIQYQARRILGTSLGCPLTDVSVTQLLANPTFTGSAASWNLTGGWSYGANAVSIVANSGHVFQAYASFVQDAMYKIVVVTTATTTGDMSIILSNAIIGTIFDTSPAGTYTFYGVADPATSTNVGVNNGSATITTTVTSIEMYAVAECFTFDVQPGSSIVFDPINGLAISGTVNISVNLPFEVSNIYSPKTTITVTDYQTGTVEFAYDGSASGALSIGNGDTTYTMNGSAFNVLGISFTNFIGTITDITFEQLSTDYFFALYDLDGNYIQSLNTGVTYCREYVNLLYDPFAEGVPHGCYKIGLYDPYLHTDQLEFYYDDFTGWSVNGGAVWTLGAPAIYTSANSNGDADTDEAAPDFEVAWVKLQFETGTLSGAGIGSASAGVELQDGTFSGISALSVTAGSNTTYRSTGEGYPPLTYTNFGFVHPKIFVTGTLAADVIEFVNAFYKVYPYHLDYLSNCITFQESFPCSKLVYALPGNNLGFGGDCGFSITKRFDALKIVPNYKISANDFISSDGTRALISGNGQKFYTFLFDYMDELGHDVVMTLILSPDVYIGDDYITITTDGTKYFILPQDYTPEWTDQNQTLNGARGRIQAMEYNQVKFTTNCED